MLKGEGFNAERRSSDAKREGVVRLNGRGSNAEGRGYES